MEKKNLGQSLFIGESSTGLPTPIFYDPHYPISLNLPPVTLITGSPGSGKTFAASILAAHSSVLNKLTFIIDPKGDFLSLKTLERQGHLNNIEVWSVFSSGSDNEVSAENMGILDPLTLTDNIDDNVAMTADVIHSLVPGVTVKQSNALIPIIQDVANMREPSTAKVIQMLQSSRDEEIRNLGVNLGIPARLSISKLLISESKTKNPFNMKQGTMVISMMGLTLPESNKKKEEQTHKERVSAVIMRLITQLVLEAMKNTSKRILKTLFVDEAWVVFGDEAGKSMIEQAGLLGRSLNMATVLATQSPGHIAEPDSDGKSNLDTTISTRFAFRNDSDIDNAITRKAMKLPANEGWEGLFAKLGVGQCMMRDCTGGLAIIHTITSQEWEDAFNTNPNAALKK